MKRTNGTRARTLPIRWETDPKQFFLETSDEETGGGSYSEAWDPPAEPARKARWDAATSLRSALYQLADGMLVIDGDGRVAAHNVRFHEIWGLDDEIAI